MYVCGKRSNAYTLAHRKQYWCLVRSYVFFCGKRSNTRTLGDSGYASPRDLVFKDFAVTFIMSGRINYSKISGLCFGSKPLINSNHRPS